MKIYEALRHTTWECKYHVVFIPKCRRKVLFGQVRQELGEAGAWCRRSLEGYFERWPENEKARSSKGT